MNMVSVPYSLRTAVHGERTYNYSKNGENREYRVIETNQYENISETKNADSISNYVKNACKLTENA